MNSSLPMMLLAISLLLTSALAAGVRGNQAVVTQNAVMNVDSCQDLVTMAIRSVPEAASQDDGKCRSVGFLYHGGPCPQGSANCQDVVEFSQQDQLTRENAYYIVVSDAKDPSQVYYQGNQEKGSYFQLSAGNDPHGLPEEYNVTIYSHRQNNNEDDHDSVSKDMLQTMVLSAPCGRGTVDMEFLPPSSVQVVFTAKHPTPLSRRRWQVELSSSSSSSTPSSLVWTVESLETSVGNDSWTESSNEVMKFGVEDHYPHTIVIPIEQVIQEEESAENDKDMIRVTAHLVSSTGQYCILERIGGMLTEDEKEGILLSKE